MPEEENKTSDGADNPLLWGVIGFIVVALIVLSAVATIPALNNQDILSESGFYPEQIIPFGNVDVGSKVINKRVVEVRQQIGGSSLGTQDKRETGKIVQGPVSKFGSNWWMIDYPNAPDGWIEEKYITSNIWMVILLNIVPIVYENIIKPLGIGLSVIGLVAFIIVKMLYGQAQEVEAKAQELRKERALRHFRPELLQAEKAVEEPGSVPVNLPTGEDNFEVSAPVSVSSGPKNERWENVKKLINSHAESDWKQAIIEADIILNNMIERMGYEGETLAEKLKQIEASDFITLDSAWQAHRVRNKIAHSGSLFKLTREEAEKTINMYQKVFEEFYYI